MESALNTFTTTTTTTAAATCTNTACPRQNDNICYHICTVTSVGVYNTSRGRITSYGKTYFMAFFLRLSKLSYVSSLELTGFSCFFGVLFQKVHYRYHKRVCYNYTCTFHYRGVVWLKSLYSRYVKGWLIPRKGLRAPNRAISITTINPYTPFGIIY